MNNSVSRRNFIRQSSLAGLGLAVAPALSFGNPLGPEKARIALIGVGLRGQNHLYNLLQRNDIVEILKEKPDWFYIASTEGQQGWIYKSLVKIVNRLKSSRRSGFSVMN